MKKLMIGLVGALAMVASAEVESENIVGFNAETLGDSANMTVPMFDGILKPGTDIQSIIPDAEDLESGCVQLKILDQYLGDNDEYYYVLAEDAPNGIAGWYDGDWQIYIERTFNAGEGFILVNDIPGAKRTFSGAVIVGKPLIELGSGANFTGNMLPIDLDIQDVKLGSFVEEDGTLSDEESIIESGCIQFKLLDCYLGDGDEYYFVTEADAPNGVAGWYDGEWSALINRTFAPGEGFILVNDLDEIWAQMPAAIEK